MSNRGLGRTGIRPTATSTAAIRNVRFTSFPVRRVTALQASPAPAIERPVMVTLDHASSGQQASPAAKRPRQPPLDHAPSHRPLIMRRAAYRLRQRPLDQAPSLLTLIAPCGHRPRPCARPARSPASGPPRPVRSIRPRPSAKPARSLASARDRVSSSMTSTPARVQPNRPRPAPARQKPSPAPAVRSIPLGDRASRPQLCANPPARPQRHTPSSTCPRASGGRLWEPRRSAFILSS
jgi:hypothetical protein